MKKMIAGLAAVVALSGVLTGCGASGNAGGFVSGNGVITWLKPSQRHKVGTIEGTLLSGKSFNLTSLRGKVVVINVWGSWCAPCRAEASQLAASARQWATDKQGTQVAFLGINTRDTSPANAQAFVSDFNIPYPSLYNPDGTDLLAFKGQITPAAIPSTIIIDPQGRIAASVIGELTSSVTLNDLIQDVIAGRADGPA